MKTSIDVKDKSEGERIRLALQQDRARAMMNVVGALRDLAPDVREKVIEYARWTLDEGVPPPVAT